MKSWYQIKAQSSSNDAHIYLYDVIAKSYWDDDSVVSAKGLLEEVQDLDVNTLHVHINSPGGDVFEGVAIYNTLKQHKATVITYIDGLAASIASVIFMAGDKRIVHENSMLMIHLPWTFAAGNSLDIRKVADNLDAITEGAVLSSYRETGLTDKALKDMLDAETWMTSIEAFDQGFATSVDGYVKPKASFDASVVARFCASIPDGVLGLCGSQKKDDKDMNLTDEFAKKYGLQPDAGEAEIEKAISNFVGKAEAEKVAAETALQAEKTARFERDRDELLNQLPPVLREAQKALCTNEAHLPSLKLIVENMGATHLLEPQVDNTGFDEEHDSLVKLAVQAANQYNDRKRRERGDV